MRQINVVLYEPEIPTNTGNIIRTCHATGAKLHIIKPIAFSLAPHWTRRAAAGRLLTDIEHEIHPSWKAFHDKYGKKELYFLTRYGQKTYSDVDFTATNNDIFIVFGRESTGIPREILKTRLEQCLRIPMVGKERSLNLANTVAIAIYEVLRQQNFNGLSTTEVQKGADYLLK